MWRESVAAAAAQPWADPHDTSPSVMRLSGRGKCAVELLRTHNATLALGDAVAADKALGLSVTFAANPGFRCVAATGSCPTVTLTFVGHPATVTLVIDEELAATGRSDQWNPIQSAPVTATVVCSFKVPAGATTLESFAVTWSVPGTGGGVFHGGSFAVYAVELVRDEVGWGDPSLSHRLLAFEDSPHALQCRRYNDARNTKATALPSCDAGRTAALGGSSFVASDTWAPPAGMVDQAIVPDVTRATRYRLRLPSGVRAGDALQLQVRAVDADGEPVEADSGQVMHVSDVQCMSGEVRGVTASDYVVMAKATVKAGATATLSFDAKATTGSSLVWRVTDGDCGGVASQCSVSDVITSGVLSGGTVPGGGAACGDPNDWCTFTATVAAAADSDTEAVVWLQPSNTLSLADGFREPSRVVVLQSLRLVLAGDATGADAGIVTSGERWQDVAACRIATTDGGVFLEYTAHIDAGAAAMQLRLRNAALDTLVSGLCTSPPPSPADLQHVWMWLCCTADPPVLACVVCADWVDPNGGDTGDAVLTYCDHDTDDGGWTLVAAQGSGGMDHAPWDTAVGLADSLPSPAPGAGGSFALGLQALALPVTEARVMASNVPAPAPAPAVSPTPFAATELYWAEPESNEVARLLLHETLGGSVEVLYGSDDGLLAPHGVAVDSRGGNLYISNTGTSEVLRAPLDGGGPVEVIITSDQVTTPGPGLAIDDLQAKLYISDESVNTYFQSHLDGPDFWAHANSGSSVSRGVEVDDSGRSCHRPIFYSGDGLLAYIMNGGTQHTLRDDVGVAWAVRADVPRNYLFWTELGGDFLGKVRRSDLWGANPIDVVWGLNWASGLALDKRSQMLYVAEYYAGRIMRATYDGENVEWLVEGRGDIGGLFLRTVWLEDPSATPAAAADPAPWTSASRVDVKVAVAGDGGVMGGDLVTDPASGAAVAAVGTASSVSVCDAAEAQRVFCAAQCASAGATSGLASVCDGVSVEGLAQTGCDATPFGVGTDVPTCSATLPGFTSVATFVRGVASEAADAVTDSATVASEQRMAPAPVAEHPLCGSLPLGQSEARAAWSCAHIARDYEACSGGRARPTSGLYWLHARAREVDGAVLTRCEMEVPGAGSGWTMVSEAGRAANGGRVSVSDGMRAFDVRGQAFDQVLVRRLTPVWCGGAANPETDYTGGTAYGTAVSFSHALAYAHAYNGSGVVVTATMEDGVGWDLVPPLPYASGVVSVRPALADGEWLLWSLRSRAGVRALAVGAIDGCVDDEGAPVDVEVAVYVRDSAATSSDAAADAAARGANAARGSYSLGSATDVPATASVELRGEPTCNEFAVDPQATDEHHPGLLPNPDPMDPVPQLAYNTPRCVDTASIAADIDYAEDVSVTPLASLQPSAAATVLHGAARDCSELLSLGYTESGYYEVYPGGAVAGATPVRVYCDQVTAGGGWTVAFAAQCGPLEWRKQLEPTIQGAAQALLSYRDEDMADVSFSARDGADAGSWAVIAMPEAWRWAHPGAAANATDVEVASMLPGESSPTLRVLRFGSAPSAAGDCSQPWAPFGVAGRVCLEGTAAPLWAGFASPSSCASVCTRSSGHSGTGTRCSEGRVASIAVRGQRDGIVSAGTLPGVTAPLGLPSRLRAQAASDEFVAAAGADQAALRLPGSCAELHRRFPTAANGMYDIRVDGATRRVFCDMANGGWRRCATAPAARFDHGPSRRPMIDTWYDDHGAASEWASSSSDCTAALEAGALVSVSNSLSTADPSLHAAVLQGPAPGAEYAGATALSWRASGRTTSREGRSPIGAFTLLASGHGTHCSAGSRGAAGSMGPLLHVQSASADNVCAAAGAYSGIHGCAGCSDHAGAFEGRPYRGQLAFWVRASHDRAHAGAPVPPPRPRTCADVLAADPDRPSGPAAVWPNGDNAAPVFVECDVGPAGAWTVVYVSEATAPADPSALSYAPGTDAIVATAFSVRLGVSNPRTVASVSAGDDFVTMLVPDAWRHAHPATVPGADLAEWPMAANGASGLGTVKFGFGAFAAASAAPDDLCSAPWLGDGNDAGVPFFGRVCASMPGASGSALVWGDFAASAALGGDPMGSHLCGVHDRADAPANSTACSTTRVFSIAVLHASARDRAEPARSCAELLRADATLSSGTYTVYPAGDVSRPASVHCDFDTAGGGWTVVFAAHPGVEYVTDPMAAGRGAQVLAYAPGTAALVNDPHNEVLMAFRDRAGVEDADAPWATFPMPPSWAVRHPGAADGDDVAVRASLEGVAGTVAATLRFGRASFAGDGCPDVWDEGDVSGRVCLDGTMAPFWSAFMAGGAPTRCGNSTSPWRSDDCAASGRLFTLAVRSTATASSRGAATSCLDVQRAGATESGTYQLFPAGGLDSMDQQHTAAELPASCGDQLRRWPTAPSGMYTILPPGQPAPVQVFCDMARGGWMHCGTALAGHEGGVSAMLGREDAGARVGGQHVYRNANGYSVDCSWALVAGAAVSLSGSTASADPVFGSATLSGDGSPFLGRSDGDGVADKQSWRWPADGVTAHGAVASSVDEFVIVGQSGSDACAGGAFGLLTSSPWAAACDSLGKSVYSGAGMCECGDSRAALRGEAVAVGGLVALWVRPPAAAAPEDSIFADCDLETRGGGWTMVFSSALHDGAGGVVDGDNTGAGLRLRGYAPGVQPLLASASSVMLALRDARGSVMGAAPVEMPMPPTWRHMHPASHAATDLPEWPVAVGVDAQFTEATVRFGNRAVTDVAGPVCNAPWRSVEWSAGDGYGDGSYGGLVCVAGTRAPLWYGWASAAVADVCGHSQADAAAAPYCTASQVFTMYVR